MSRYIHLNPVVANICDEPERYEWSSFRAYSTNSDTFTWLKTKDILEQIGGRNAYHRYVSHGNEEKIESFYRREQTASILGSEEFVNEKLNMLDATYVVAVQTDFNRTLIAPNPEVVLTCVAQYYNIKLNEIVLSLKGKKNTPRLMAIYLLKYESRLSHKEIALHMARLVPASIAMLISRSLKLYNENETFRVDAHNIQAFIKSKLLGVSL